jgi:tRNAThr (cytosine32-N3)-methyltransferase
MAEQEISQQHVVDRKKTPKQQLSKGMQHMREWVTVQQDTPDTLPHSDPPTNTTEQVQDETAYGVPGSFQPLRKPQTDSANNDQKRTDPFQFGTRHLEEGDNIFSHNAWDHVETDDTYKEFIKAQAEFQRSAPVTDFDKKRFNQSPEKWWDKFYSNNTANFFKDRKWLAQEFPVLGDITKEDYGAATMLEVGAGAGNTAYPVLNLNKNPLLKIHACDYSKKAIEIIRSQDAYQNQNTLQADVWDAAGTGEQALPPGLEAGSVDVVVMIFIFSALSPRQWAQAVKNAWNVLKPGGLVLFRDYGRGDLAQVRFKKGRYLEENFYIRGDGTRVYFFERDELADIWSGKLPANSFQVDASEQRPNQDEQLADKLQNTVISPEAEENKMPAFEIQDLGVDNRMLVNRQRKLKMYRCWMQGRFQKPVNATSGLHSR